MTKAQLHDYLQRADAFYEDAVRYTLPYSVEMLSDLSLEQIQTLQERLIEDKEQQEKKYLDENLAKRHERHAELMEDTLSDWAGPLTDTERQNVKTWAYALDDMRQHYIANQMRWQSKFIALLQANSHEVFAAPQAEFEPALYVLLAQADTLWPAPARENWEANLELAFNLLTQFQANLTQKQLNSVQQRLNKYSADFRHLSQQSRCQLAKAS